MKPEKRAKCGKEMTPAINVPIERNLFFRMERISERTGLSWNDLLSKWLFQEEALIALLSTRAIPETSEASNIPCLNSADVRNRPAEAEDEPRPHYNFDPKKPKDRKKLVKDIKTLRKSGMSLKKIAEVFNDGKISTLSGTGKWYAAAISRILSAENTERAKRLASQTGS
jgi:hypothetical protein